MTPGLKLSIFYILDLSKMLKTKKKAKLCVTGTCFYIQDFYIVSTKRSLVMEILLNEFTWQGQVMPIIKRFVKE